MLATLTGAVIIIAVVASAYGPASRVSELRETRDESVKQAGLWLRSETSQASRDVETPARPQLMGFSAALSFYSGAVLSYLPYANSDRALEYIRKKAPDFIALRSSERNLAPYTLEWLDAGIPDECAVPVFQTRSSIGVLARVWRWTCRG
jgi:hypothetical protein